MWSLTAPVLLQVLCDHYWPSESAPVSYGQVRVHLLMQSSSEEWTVREFKLWHVSADPRGPGDLSGVWGGH